MPAPRWLFVGRITSPFGIRGEVRAMLDTEFPERLVGRPVYLGPEHRRIEVEQVRLHRREGLLKIAGVDTPEAADALRGQDLFVATADAAPLPEGRYYHHQIIGLQVVTVDGRPFGEVRDVLSRPANDVYVVEHEGREALIPAIADVVKQIDIENGRMVIELIDGL